MIPLSCRTRSCAGATGLALQQSAALTAPKRIERLNSNIPNRRHPRPGRMLDRRANLELRLKRSLIVQRRAKMAQFEKDVGET